MLMNHRTRSRVDFFTSSEPAMGMNPKQQAARGRVGGSSPVGRTIVLIGMMVLAAILVPAARIMLVGMAPTLIAYLMSHLLDRSGDRHAVLCIGICNVSGLVLFVIAAFKAPGGVSSALGETNVMFALFAAYGSAALGWLIHWTAPLLYGKLIRMRSEFQLKRVAAEQDALVAEWGEAVATPDE